MKYIYIYIMFISFIAERGRHRGGRNKAETQKGFIEKGGGRGYVGYL